MIILLGLVAAVTIVKAYFLGLFSVLIDVLWVAICRYDYCLLILFIILSCRIFTIVVILGYYL
jgi:hypothetical protein